jgi:hypothetical protein
VRARGGGDAIVKDGVGCRVELVERVELFMVLELVLAHGLGLALVLDLGLELLLLLEWGAMGWRLNYVLEWRLELLVSAGVGGSGIGIGVGRELVPEVFAGVGIR